MWEAWLADTRTGRLGARLGLLDGGSWAETINAASDATITVEHPGRLGIPAERWFLPWRNSIVLTVDGEPLIFGPILAPPEVQPVEGTVSYRVGDALSIFSRRFAVRDTKPGDEAALAKSVLSFKRMSLGSIMWRLVRSAMDRRGGDLPIVHGSPDETSLTGGHERTYKGFDITNLGIAHLIDLLANVVDGPDFAFRPRWADRSQRRVEWVFEHGTQVSPRLVQSELLVIDERAARADISEFRVLGQYEPANWVAGTGAGQDAGTLIAVAETDVWDVPRLEAVWADTSNESKDLLERHARARLGDASLVTMQVNAGVAPAVIPVTAWHAGEDVRVVLGERWAPWPEGEHTMTIIKRSGQIGSRVVSVEAQKMLPIERLGGA